MAPKLKDISAFLRVTAGYTPKPRMFGGTSKAFGNSLPVISEFVWLEYPQGHQSINQSINQSIDRASKLIKQETSNSDDTIL